MNSLSGIYDCENVAEFEERAELIVSKMLSICPEIENYMKNRIIPLMRDYVMKPVFNGNVKAKWKSNESESMNHVLKMLVNWQKVSMVDFVEKIHDELSLQFCDYRRAMHGTGCFRLAPKLRSFAFGHQQWLEMTDKKN